MVERPTQKESNQTGDSILTQEFVEPILAVTKEFLKYNDHLGPALFLRMENEERSIVPLTHFDDLKSMAERKEYFISLGLSIRLSGMRIREAILVSEVWYVEPEEDALDAPPSKHPKRKEAISIVGRDSEGVRFIHVLQPFSRDDQNFPVYEAVEADFNVEFEEGNYPTSLIDHLFDE